MTCRTRIRYQKHSYSRPPGRHKKRISPSKPRYNALGQRLFKTEPLYSPTTGDETNPGFFQSLLTFFAQLWSPATTDPEKLGYAYIYGAPGTPTADTLLGEYGSGGANSAGSAIHVYLPTPNGPMPIAAFINGAKHAVHSDHLNTPRKLTRANSWVAWQWAYSAFGDAPPTLAADRYVNPLTTTNAGTTSIPRIEYNLRYPGQVFDKESNLSYNYFRTYDAKTGRYTQSDPIGLDGGWNRFGYVGGNPLSWTDPEGLKRKAPPIPGNFGKQPYVPDSWRSDTSRRYRDGHYAPVCVKTSCEFGSPSNMCTMDDPGGTGRFRRSGPFMSAPGQQMSGCECTKWALDWREGLRPPTGALDKANLVLQTLGGGY
jgi:RHS repeat-associated protein